MNSNQGVKKFESGFKKKPRLVAGLSSFEVGYGRGFRVFMSTEAGEESVSWGVECGGG